MIRSKRTKPRPGRLKGNDLELLRRRCFERDGFRCIDCGKPVQWDSPYASERGEMAHIRVKRIAGDVLGNVKTSCHECHRRFHQYGPTLEKPCKSKKGL